MTDEQDDRTAGRDLRLTREQGSEDQRRLAIVGRRIGEETAKRRDQAWLDAFHCDEGRVREIVEAGQARRAAREAAE
ncbi:hypothetical protein [Histidinibacterium aquaticum]|uniref:Uncharacterized protein n=1 Tax=Histidinibacterium aquaticum TaxID=2613962 RepID=A0A5J5GKB2_9RHOB|nr:hypothetical protein [Histidinibacterium aquaticum]KAA9008103.1 hypothetical protein F3S47_11390 [Histidinibacterium aquaticum]